MDHPEQTEAVFTWQSAVLGFAAYVGVAIIVTMVFLVR